MTCDSPSDTGVVDQVYEEICDEDESGGQTNPDTPSPSFETELDFPVSKSTKGPLKIKPNRKKQAEEEYKLIKGLAESIGERRNK